MGFLLHIAPCFVVAGLGCPLNSFLGNGLLHIAPCIVVAQITCTHLNPFHCLLNSGFLGKSCGFCCTSHFVLLSRVHLYACQSTLTVLWKSRIILADGCDIFSSFETWRNFSCILISCWRMVVHCGCPPWKVRGEGYHVLFCLISQGCLSYSWIQEGWLEQHCEILHGLEIVFCADYWILLSIFRPYHLYKSHLKTICIELNEN